MTLAGFLAGSFPTGYLIAKSRGIDIRTVGSGNIGATNVGRILGPKAWLLCFAIDLAKGLLPTLAAGIAGGTAGRLFMPPIDAWGWLLAMLGPILGHMFCPWLGFKGGKGVATGLGSLMGVFPALTLPAAAAFAVFIAALAAWRYVSLAAMLAAASLPFSVWAFFAFCDAQHWFPAGRSDDAAGPTPFIALTALVAALVILRHRANIARLLAGSEPRLGVARARRDP
ncbi:MAG: glycerol-3-phosphate 1-O-acyltransferase PlsY [Phycisphaeraceae bacterium]|nr:MAG: glycerol-3-phosphate 1-O-acyltransferase PlsY [Phycisphaeraceae bacterium]